MATILQIKRSSLTATPGSLANGEMAFTSNGYIFYIGDPATDAVLAIGGRRYPGTLTANQAIVVDANSMVNQFIAGNVTANVTINSLGVTVANSTESITYGPAGTPATAGGSNTDVQFNNSASLAGTGGFTFNYTTNNALIGNTLTIGTTIANSTLLTVGGTGNITPTGLTFGSTANVSLNSIAEILQLNSTANVSIFAPNSSANGLIFLSSNATINASMNSSFLQIANSTGTTNLTATGLVTNTGTFSSTLSTTGNASFTGTNTYISATNTTIAGTGATISAVLGVSANATFSANLTTSGSNTYLNSTNNTIAGTGTTISSVLGVSANATFSANVTTSGANTYLNSTNNTIAGTGTTISSPLGVSGVTTVSANASFTANLTASGANVYLNATNTTIAGTGATISSVLGVTANATFSANVTTSGSNTYLNSTNNTIAGTGTTISSILGVSANATFASNLTMTSNTGFILPPAGNTSQRTGSANGTLRFNTDNQNLEVYIDGYQWEPMQSIPIGATIGSDPVVEGSATNLLIYSQTFTNGAWVTTNMTVTANNTTAPDGTLASTKILATTSTATVNASQQVTIASNATNLYTFSCYVANTVNATYSLNAVFQLQFNQGGGAGTAYNCNVAFNPSNGMMTAAGAPINYGSVMTANGWWRVWLTANTKSTDLRQLQVAVYPDVSGNKNILNIFGAQLEVNSYATSYINTLATTITRPAGRINQAAIPIDLNTLSVDGNNNLYTPAPGGIGSNTYLYFNDSGYPNTTSALAINKTTNVFTFGGNVNITGYLSANVDCGTF